MNYSFPNNLINSNSKPVFRHYNLSFCLLVDLSLDYEIEDHPNLRHLFSWLSDPLLRIEPTDLSLISNFPPCIQSPLALKMPRQNLDCEPTIFKLIGSSQLRELYAYSPRNQLETDLHRRFIIIEPAFSKLFCDHYVKTPSETSFSSQNTISATPRPSQTDRMIPASQLSQYDSSISLNNWTPSQENGSQSVSGQECIKMENKNMLKKLLLLSLRHVGVDKHHSEFASIWKHLYCGCLFAFRKELGIAKIRQSEMLSVIRSNMNFLNIK